MRHNEYAYPLNTIGKEEIMQEILAYSKSKGIIGLGRWGEWQHYNTAIPRIPVKCLRRHMNNHIRLYFFENFHQCISFHNIAGSHFMNRYKQDGAEVYGIARNSASSRLAAVQDQSIIRCDIMDVLSSFLSLFVSVQYPLEPAQKLCRTRIR